MDISGWIAFITAVVVFASGSYFATRETPRTPVVIEALLVLFATLGAGQIAWVLARNFLGH
jgi:hypothetical protein